MKNQTFQISYEKYWRDCLYRKYYPIYPYSPLNSNQAPPIDADGFRRISNPFNWPPISNQLIAEPPYPATPEYLHPIENLQFLGFQWAVAEYIFADFTSPERKDVTSPLSLVDLAYGYITAAEVAAEQNARRKW